MQLIFREFIRSNSGLIVNKIMLRVFGLEMAVFIADLADRDNYFSKANGYDGWFFSTKELRSSDLGLSEKALQRLMSAARDDGLLDTEMRGNPAKQWVRIRYDEIYSVLHHFSLDSPRYASLDRKRQASLDSPVEAYNHTNNHTKETKTSLSQLSVTTQKVPKENINRRYLSLAEQLANATHLLGRKKENQRTLLQWAGSFRLLHTNDNYKIEDIKKVLNWYCDNIRTEWTQAFCGKSFREKYFKLKIRSEQNNSTGKQQIKYGHEGTELKYKPDVTTDNSDVYERLQRERRGK